jgi:tRNA (guanine-N7-)-methyltransferase
MNQPEHFNQPPPRRIEREFGVPFPGQILEPSRWNHAANLKQLPDGPIDFEMLFNRSSSVILDLGCGNGRYLIGEALSHRDRDFVGVDILPVVIRYARKRSNQRGLTNVRFAVIGGYELVEKHIAPASVAEIHCYHPQPYYDPAQVHRRLITPGFLRLVHQCLKPGGLFVIQTDNPGYWKYIREIVPIFFDFQERIGRWPDSPRGRSRREILAMKKKLPIFRGFGTAKRELDSDMMMQLAEKLPAPTFDADRRLRSLDELA